MARHSRSISTWTAASPVRSRTRNSPSEVRCRGCQAHKTPNVVDQLPDDMKPSVRQALREAYAASDGDRARTMLTNFARRLRDNHPGAASSLEEGLDETLSVKRLRLPKKLERQLSTTNAIENLMGSVRRLSRRVKR